MPASVPGPQFENELSCVVSGYDSTLGLYRDNGVENGSYYRILGPYLGFGVQGFRVQGSGSRVKGQGVRVSVVSQNGGPKYRHQNAIVLMKSHPSFWATPFCRSSMEVAGVFVWKVRLQIGIEFLVYISLSHTTVSIQSFIMESMEARILCSAFPSHSQGPSVTLNPKP